MKKIILTADRPTGNLHIGHYVGSIANRLKLQEQNDYEKYYIMIADTQALTDNADNVDKVKNNIIQVAIDYLSAGIDPNKVEIFIQSQVPELAEMTMYFMNLVTVARLTRNPTVKDEIKQRGFANSLPVGFLCYPISQAADICAFNANCIPVGEDQLPMLEQAREIVRSFNHAYGKEVLTLPEPLLPENEACRRLPGIDGGLKMSKSAGNCIYLKDEPEEIKRKVMSAYTDPNHIKISDPGKVEGNVVFKYLDAFATDESFKKFLPEYKNLEELKAHYRNGGLGDVKIKLFLNNVLQELLAPIRERRKALEKDIDSIYKMLFENGKKVRKIAGETILRMKEAMGLDYEKLLKKEN
ncbi:MAG: tryptophan--tRNA ligase [Clostridiales bacterium]|nr:tryptophan--tRNA ligase [Clostridiales bacterium]